MLKSKYSKNHALSVLLDHYKNYCVIHFHILLQVPAQIKIVLLIDMAKLTQA